MAENHEIAGFEEFVRTELGIEDFKMPTTKQVCPTCHGEGTHGPGWVFTEEDRYEMGYEFDEMMDEMRRGTYNVPCEHCNGHNVIDEVNTDLLPDNIRHEWNRWMESYYDTLAIERMERMMGA